MSLAHIVLLAAVCFADGVLLLLAAPQFPPKSSSTWRQSRPAPKTWATRVTAMFGPRDIGNGTVIGKAMP
jgi:hypothetical protein